MASREKIDSIFDFSDKALGELKAWLEPWFPDRVGAAAADDDDLVIVSQKGDYTLVPSSIDAATTEIMGLAYQEGDALLDLTSPTFPKIVTAGIYSISMVIGTTTDITPGANVGCRISTTVNGDSLGNTGVGTQDVGLVSLPGATVLLNTCYLVAGVTVTFQASNIDVSAWDFEGSVRVVRIF